MISTGITGHKKQFLYYHWQSFWRGGGEAGLLGGEASPLPPPVDRTLINLHQEYISIESMQLPETAFLHIDVTSSSANPISGGVVV